LGAIAGVFNLDGRPVETGLIDRMLDRMAHRAPDGLRTWVDGPIALGSGLMHVTPESVFDNQPVEGPDGSVTLFDGRLDDRDDLASILRVDARGLSDPEVVSAAYRRFGDDFPRWLLGDFCAAVFDPASMRLLLARDVMGPRALHVWRNDRTCVFASEIHALLAHPGIEAVPSHDRLAKWLLGMPWRADDAYRTFFEGINSVPKGYIMKVGPEGIGRRQYWSFDETKADRASNIDEGLGFWFERAVERRVRSRHPVTVSVSGGLDSSSIFGTALRLVVAGDPPVLGVTYSMRDGSVADEMRFIGAVERRFDTQVRWVPTATALDVDRCIQTVLGAESPLGLWPTLDDGLHSTLDESGSRSLLSGLWGDEVTFSRGYLVDMARRLRFGSVLRHLTEFPRWFTETSAGWPITRGLFYDLVYAHVPDLLYRERRRLYSRRAATKSVYTDAFRARARERFAPPNMQHGWRSYHREVILGLVSDWTAMTRTEIQSKVIHRHGAEASFPFLDRDLVAFIASNSGEFMNWKGVPKAGLRMAASDVLPGMVRDRTSKGDWTSVMNDVVDRSWASMREVLLDDGCLAMRIGVVDRERLVRALKASGGLPPQRSMLAGRWLIDVFALEVWLRAFAAKASA